MNVKTKKFIDDINNKQNLILLRTCTCISLKDLLKRNKKKYVNFPYYAIIEINLR